MTTKLISGLDGVMGCRFLPGKRQLLFVERNRGAISILGIVPQANSNLIVSQGTKTITGNGLFNLDPAPREFPIRVQCGYSLGADR